MIRIDDSLLAELGLDKLPKEERDGLLAHIYETLEMRVGMKLAERMSEAQLDEFERFMKGDAGYIELYLRSVNPDWQRLEEYQKMLAAAEKRATQSGGQLNSLAVQSEFAALKWLELNFPDYKDVVAAELERLKQEIKRDAHNITSAVQADLSAPDAGDSSAI